MKKITCLVLSVFLFNFCCLSPLNYVKAAGATLFLSPSSGTYNVGQSFTVNAMVNSGGGDGINAAEGTIKFDPSLVTVSKVSNSSSIFKLWTIDPVFSNTNGTISFGGGLPGAYKSTAGLIFNITFVAKKAGTANVTFTSGTVLAADGKGTDIFSGFGQAKFTINEVPVEKPAETKTEPVVKETPKKEEVKQEKGLLPPMPEIVSITHPEEDKWYADNNPEFSWKTLSDLTGVSYSVTDSPTSDPGSKPEGIIESKKIENVSDGVKYFHIKYQNKSGWGPTAHRKFLIDATSPKTFNIVFDNGGDTTNPSPRIRFKTTDDASGVDYYNLEIGGKKSKISTQDMEKGYYEFNPLIPGEYSIAVIAVDKAENKASSSLSFAIEPLKAPVITSIPKVIKDKDDLIVQGTSFYPNVDIKVYISKQGKEPVENIVKADGDGNWSYFHKGRLEAGTYEVWAKLVDQRKAESLDSVKYVLLVESSSILEQYSLWIIFVLWMLLIVSVLFIIYQQKRFAEERFRIRRETQELKMKIGKIFAALREEVDELVELADKKTGFSESERRVKEKLQESLDISEEFIGKEVEDVEKEIRVSGKKKGKK